jgi:hypothetical protein
MDNSQYDVKAVQIHPMWDNSAIQSLFDLFRNDGWTVTATVQSYVFMKLQEFSQEAIPTTTVIFERKRE